MKKVWIEVDTWDKSFITDALENSVDAFFVKDAALIPRIEELARIEVYNLSDLPSSIQCITVDSKEMEIKAASLPTSIALIVDTGEWRIIPFENLIAVRDNLFARVSSLTEAREALEILEKGVDGVYCADCSSAEKMEILRMVRSDRGKVPLSAGEVIQVSRLMTGDRVCIDTITNMYESEGMLVGDFSHGMVLVNAEVMENPYVASRPFRVNAGAVHCYIMTPGNRTKYLADLAGGEEVLLVSHDGSTRLSMIGRIKCERRPMLRIVVQGQKRQFSVVLQNAETIRVVLPDGSSKSVVKLEAGDSIAIYEEEGGRHFGCKIEETIDEK